MRRGMRMGRPTLIGTMARTAVVAGTASAVIGHSQQKQAAGAQQAAMANENAQKAAAYDELQQQAAIDAQVQAQVAAQLAAQQQAAAAPPPPPPAAAPAAGGDDTIAQLQKLAELKTAGILTEEEFAAQKAKILGM
jgi:hypothetical protein